MVFMPSPKCEKNQKAMQSKCKNQKASKANFSGEKGGNNMET